MLFRSASVISIPVPTEAPVAFDTAAIDGESVFTVSAPWIEGGAIPSQYSCRGGDVAPVFTWAGSPESTASYALVFLDTTNTSGDGVGFVHYVAYNIDPTFTSLDTANTPVGAVVAPSDFSTPGHDVTVWRGPCPPLGQTHTYVIELHALDQTLDSLDGATAADVVTAIDAATIATTSVSAVDTGI